jgi:hypothetical protein
LSQLLTEFAQSRSLRQHRKVEGADDALPTPPSTASTPPTTDDLPPRKRVRYNPINTPTVPTTEMGEGFRIPRIRIKMAPEGERRSSTRLSVKHETTSESDSTNPPDSGENKVNDCEMIETSENWRVIGLSNVGNTCFTNAILQVFSYFPFLTKIEFRQTEILGEFFIKRLGYKPPSLINTVDSADFTSRSSRSKTKRNLIESDPPSPRSKYPLFFL